MPARSSSKRPRSAPKAQTQAARRSVERHVVTELSDILSSTCNGRKLKLKKANAFGMVARSARALVRWLSHRTTLSPNQIAQATRINIDAVKKVINNSYQGGSKGPDNLEEDDGCFGNLNSAHLCAILTWHERHFGSTKVDQELEVPSDDSDYETDSDEEQSNTKDACVTVTTRPQTRARSQIPSRLPVRFASVPQTESAKRKRGRSDTATSTSSARPAKRQRRTEVDVLSHFFAVVGYSPADPATLIKQGFGCHELKTIAEFNEDERSRFLQFFPTFKEFPGKAKVLSAKLGLLEPDVWNILD